MKLKKRKIKFAAIFCLCWFAFLVFLVDGVLKFQTLVDYFGSYAFVEITLLLLVILPTIAVYILTKEDKTMSKRDYIQANKDWLEAKSKEEGVKALPKGIYYKVLSEGDASSAQPTVLYNRFPWESILKYCQRVTLRVLSRQFVVSSQPTTQVRPSMASSLTVAVAVFLWLAVSVT